MIFGPYPFIVGREPGPQTITGAGDILIDNNGRRYREVDSAEATMIRNSTGGGHVYELHSDGTIR